MKNRFEEFQSFMDRALELHLELREDLLQKGAELRPMETQTLRVDLGRRTGKSEWIKGVFTPERDLLIAPTMVACQAAYPGYLKRFKNVWIAGNWKRKVRGSGVLKFDRVFVDEPSFVFRTKDSVFDFYRCIHANTYILLGC